MSIAKKSIFPSEINLKISFRFSINSNLAKLIIIVFFLNYLKILLINFLFDSLRFAFMEITSHHFMNLSKLLNFLKWLNLDFFTYGSKKPILSNNNFDLFNTSCPILQRL